MTRAELDIFLRSVVATVLLATATAANATLYRWVDERGHVTYSNAPPPPGARVREVLTLDEARPPTASELRTRQILEEAERERRQSDGDLAGEGMASPVYAYGVPESRTSDGLSPAESRPVDSASFATGTPANPGPRTNAATRDPCLMSQDPRCYELNARSYDPYLGYKAGQADTASPPVGVTADAGGPQVVEASATLSPRPAPAVPRLTGLPPGTTVLPLTRSRSGSQPFRD